MQAIYDKAQKIRLIVFDVDGVFTNGSLILGEKGDEYKVFHVHDGLGLVMLQEAGLKVAVISARSTPIVAERMAGLGNDYVYQGQNDRQTVIIELMQKLKVSEEETAYVGDDLVDLPAMRQTGLAIAVANAQPLVLERADWVTSKDGGNGAVREVCEMILKAQDLLDTAVQRYLVD